MQACQPGGRRNRDHLYGSRDAQGESVRGNTGEKGRWGGPIQEGRSGTGGIADSGTFAAGLGMTLLLAAVLE